MQAPWVPRVPPLIPDIMDYVDALYEHRRKFREANPDVRPSWGHGDLDAAGAIGTMGTDALPFLLDMLRKDRHRGLVIFALGKMGRAAAPALIEALDDPDPAVRAAIVEVLADIEPAPETVLEALRRAQRDPAPEVRTAAAEGLAHLAEEADVLHALRSGDPGVRERALEGLRQRDRLSNAIQAQLLAMMTAPRKGEEPLLLKLARRMGSAAAAATPHLLRILARRPDTSYPKPEELIRALGPGAGVHLVRGLDDASTDVRAHGRQGAPVVGRDGRAHA